MKLLAYLCNPETMFIQDPNAAGCLWNFLILPVKMLTLAMVCAAVIAQIQIWELTHGAPDWRRP